MRSIRILVVLLVVIALTTVGAKMLAKPKVTVKPKPNTVKKDIFPKRNPKIFPTKCAGISITKSYWKDVKKRYGVGVYNKDEGHGGGYF